MKHVILLRLLPVVDRSLSCIGFTDYMLAITAETPSTRACQGWGARGDWMSPARRLDCWKLGLGPKKGRDWTGCVGLGSSG